jgi:predicted AlkP superfamily phosphohydrolase/phosphomutase
MFFDALDKVPRGLVACVFDGTDRLQHTFWRDIDERHPARPDAAQLAGRNVIEDLYRRMDVLVGKTMEKCRGDDTLLMVLSDHGFGPFRTGIDLNRWLEENGFLAVDDRRREEEHLAGVDWSRTRAFAIGLAGIFINLKDKYEQGIVEPGREADRLREEIAGRLEALTDPSSDESAVKRVYIAGRFYRGPYKDNAPDLIVGYRRGYRISWEAAIGKTTRDVFRPNTKAWSGDHCVDPSLVPGIMFCNRPIADENPRLIDVAPTVLSLFGVDVPDYMDGKAMTVGGLAAGARGEREKDLAEAAR